MGKRRRIASAILLVVVLSGAAWLVLRPRELAYQGKSLSFWLEKYASTDGGTGESQAEQAILEIGTNALTLYVEWLGQKDSASKEKVILLLRKQSLFAVPWYSPREHRIMARIGLGVLGAKAAPAVPALIDLLNNNDDTDVQGEVVMSLGRIGPAAGDAVPALIKCLRGTNRFAIYFVPGALASIGLKPELSVPALIQYIADSKQHPSDQRRTIEALGDFGDKAKSAVPALLPFLSHADPDIRSAVTNALKAIDPEAAPKAGLK